MPLTEPTFDTRTYREILNEALARIPTHNPEWTNYNEADPGITLLQLFAFMSESIIYRANLIPERNRRKFLRLLGIPMLAAEAAHGLVAFSNPKGTLEAVTLQQDRLLYAGDVPFRTEQGLDVLPIEAALYYKSPLSEQQATEVDTLYRQLYASYDLPGYQLEFYETKEYIPAQAGSVLPTLDIGTQTIDGSLWVALLARSGDSVADARTALAGKTLSLGVMPALAEEGCTLYPRGRSAANERPALIFEIPNTDGTDADYAQVTPRGDSNLLEQPGIVELPLPEAAALDYWDALDPLETGVGDYPPSLDDTDNQDRLITWIRIRSPDSGSQQNQGSRQVNIPLSWVGINAVEVVQRAHVQTEHLAIGSGEPDQTATLTNTPVLLNSVQIRINGELWERIDDLNAAGPEIPARAPRFAATSGKAVGNNEKVKAYTVDRESGTVRFGDGLHGKRPPKGASIQATYDYGGGRRGSVGIGVINKATALPAGIKVTNPVPTWGGEEGEAVSQAEKRIPNVIRHRDRMVTKQDYKEIAETTPGVDLGRVEILPMVHPGQPLQDSYGVVTVLVIPRNDPLQPEAPRPDNLFLETMCRHLEPRRVLTTELHILGPVYVPVWVSLGVDVIPGYDSAPVLEAVRTEVKRFLSPLSGGFETSGWPLNKAVEAAEISADAARVTGIAKVNEIFIGGSSGTVADRIPIEGLQLPRLMAVAVGVGSATPIEELQGTLGAADDESEELKSRPVPIVPETC